MNTFRTMSFMFIVFEQVNFGIIQFSLLLWNAFCFWLGGSTVQLLHYKLIFKYSIIPIARKNSSGLCMAKFWTLLSLKEHSVWIVTWPDSLKMLLNRSTAFLVWMSDAVLQKSWCIHSNAVSLQEREQCISEIADTWIWIKWSKIKSGLLTQANSFVWFYNYNQ